MSKIEVIKTRLAEGHQSDPYFQGLRLLMNEALAEETLGALAPDLTDAARHYNAGRAAGLSDWWHKVQELTPKGTGDDSKM